MARKQFKILVTGGTWTKEFLYFRQETNGEIYYGEIGLKELDKTSRHVSGVAHNKRGDRLIKLGKGLKLTEFKGLHQLFVMSIGKLVFESSAFGKIFTNKKNNGTVTIDTRRFSHKVGIVTFLLEPEQTADLSKLSQKLKDAQITIFTETTPWFIVAIYKAGIPVTNQTNSNILPPEKTLMKIEVPASEKGGHLILIDGPAN